MNFRKLTLLGVFIFCTFILATSGWAQSSGTITGVVKDATGGVLTTASVEISDVVSGYHRETTTGIAGDSVLANPESRRWGLAFEGSPFACAC